MVKQALRSSMMSLSQSIWNGSMRRSACLEAAGQLSLRKLDLSLCLGTACGKGCLSENGPCHWRYRSGSMRGRQAMATFGRLLPVWFGACWGRKRTFKAGRFFKYQASSGEAFVMGQLTCASHARHLSIMPLEVTTTLLHLHGNVGPL
jgi:hypothetical protein